MYVPPVSPQGASCCSPSEITFYRVLIITGVALTLLALIALIGTFHPQTEEFTSFFTKAGEITARVAKYLQINPLSLSFFTLTVGFSLWVPATIYWCTLPSSEPHTTNA